MKVFYTKRAVKDLSALPAELQKRIADKMRFFISEKNPLKYAEKLKDPNLGDYRFRIRHYRVAF